MAFSIWYTFPKRTINWLINLFSSRLEGRITHFEFNPTGESIATLDNKDVCLMSKVDTNKYNFHLKIGVLSGNLEMLYFY